MKKMPYRGSKNVGSLMKRDSLVLQSGRRIALKIRGLSKKPACRIAGFYIMALVSIL